MIFQCLATVLILFKAVKDCVDALVERGAGEAMMEASLTVVLLYLLYAGGFYG